MKNAVSVTRKQLEMAKAHAVVFQPSLSTSQLEKEKNDNFVMSPLWTSDCKEVYQSVKREVMRSVDYAVKWN